MASEQVIIDNQNDNTIYKYLEQNQNSQQLQIITDKISIVALLKIINITQNSDIEIILKTENNDDENDNIPISLEKNIYFIFESIRALNNTIEIIKKNQLKIYKSTKHHTNIKIFIHNDFIITGSSSLTLLGLGLEKNTQFMNYNIIYKKQNDTTTIEQSQQLFNNLSLVSEKSQKSIIERLNQFLSYEPIDIYNKIVSLMCNGILDRDTQADTENLMQNSTLWGLLYEFQKEAVHTLTQKINNFNGAMLSDAVGLGKTFTALGVAEYYMRTKGHRVIVICPKKLEANWKKYRNGSASNGVSKENGNILHDDELDYNIIPISQLQNAISDTKDDNTYSLDLNILKRKPHLFIIDESHNFRNADKEKDTKNYKQIQYNAIQKILKTHTEHKVLLLTATPINNSIDDLKNQLKLISKDEVSIQDKNQGTILNIDSSFKEIKDNFLKWCDMPHEENAPKPNLYKYLGEQYREICINLIVARTRRFISENYKDSNFKFPKVDTAKDENANIIFGTSIDDIIQNFPSLLIYNASTYLGGDKKQTHADYQLRGLMGKMTLKRIESSWMAGLQTMRRMLARTELAIQKVQSKIDASSLRSTKKEDIIYELVEEDFQDSMYEELKDSIESVTVHFDNLIEQASLSDLKRYLEKLIEDKNKLSTLIKSLNKKSDNDVDTKLQKLIDIIEAKQKSPCKKVLIFTMYTDTAKYLHNELKLKYKDKIGLATGEIKNIEEVLSSFSPKSKAIRAVKNEIDILIATDVVSEGQNLQDADLVVNYDVHWNPARLIQRLGRINRIGSAHSNIGCITFWSAENVEKHLNLELRVTRRLMLMATSGSDVADHGEEFSNMQAEFENDNNEYLIVDEKKMEELAKQFKNFSKNPDDLETVEDKDTVGFTNEILSDGGLHVDEIVFSKYDKDNLNNIKKLPDGIFSGVMLSNKQANKFSSNDVKAKYPAGITALLKHSKEQSYHLIHLYKEQVTSDVIDIQALYKMEDMKGIMTVLRESKDNKKMLSSGLQNGDAQLRDNYIKMFKLWLANYNEKLLADKTNQGVDKFLKKHTKGAYDDDAWEIIAWLEVQLENEV